MSPDDSANSYIESQQERDHFIEKAMTERDLTFNEAVMEWEEKLVGDLEGWDE